MKEIIKNLKYVFNPKSIAVIGASRDINKIGNIILRNLLKNFNGKVYAINPKAKEIEGVKSYKSILDIKGKVEGAVIAVPAKLVVPILKQCAKKGVKGVVIISGGFKNKIQR